MADSGRLKLSRELDMLARRADSHIDIARDHARTGRLALAADALEVAAPIMRWLAQLDELTAAFRADRLPRVGAWNAAADQDFQPMRRAREGRSA